MQCVACGRANESPADACPTCGTPTSARQEYGAPPSGTPPYGSASQSPAPGREGPDYVSFPADIVEGRRRRRKRVLIGSAAAIAALAALVVTLKVTAASSYQDTLDVPLAGPAVADEGGVAVSYPAAHFSDLFPSAPVETQKSNSFGSQTVTVSAATVASPDRVMVACEETNVDIPADQVGTALQFVVVSIPTAAGYSVKEQHPTLFRGRQASQGSLTDKLGKSYTFLAFMYSRTRLYMFLAPSGQPFDMLTASFAVIK